VDLFPEALTVKEIEPISIQEKKEEGMTSELVRTLFSHR